MKILVNSVVAAVFVTAGAYAAAAAEPDRTAARHETVTIDLSAFDQSTPQGRKAAYFRVATSAGQFCSPHLRGVASSRKAYRACVDQIVETAIADGKLVERF